MPDRVRVSVLAKVLGVSPKDVLAKLAEMGEYVKSAASIIEPPVVKRLREAFPDAPGPAAPRQPQRRSTRIQYLPAAEVEPRLSERVRDPFDPLYIPVRKAPRGPYRGDAPTGLKRLILDEYVVRRSDTRRPRGGIRYWASEVDEADSLTDKWAPAMLDGMTEAQILRWMQVLSAYSAEKAAALFAEGVGPDEIEFDRRFDIGRPSLQTRLSVGNITPAEAASEVRQRRNAS